MNKMRINSKRLLPVAFLYCCACGGREALEVPVRVEGVAFDQAAQAPVIFLHEEKGERRLPIWIGLAEAQAIAGTLRLSQWLEWAGWSRKLLQPVLLA